MTMNTWVMPTIVNAELGLRPNKLRSMVQRNKLIRGVHYKVIDGNRMYCLETIKNWFAEQETPAAPVPPTPNRMQLRTPT